MNRVMAHPVECHSGYEYAQRPIGFLWEGEYLRIDVIIAEWRTPEGKGFRVRVVDGHNFELFYTQESDSWDIRES